MIESQFAFVVPRNIRGHMNCGTLFWRYGLRIFRLFSGTSVSESAALLCEFNVPMLFIRPCNKLPVILHSIILMIVSVVQSFFCIGIGYLFDRTLLIHLSIFGILWRVSLNGSRVDWNLMMSDLTFHWLIANRIVYVS